MSEANGQADYFKDGRETAVFVRTVDGDTAWFEMDGVRYKVRFLGVDSPEIDTEDGSPEPYAEKAAEFVADTLENATTIVLESDPQSDVYDNYDRLLCWIWADGILLNAELVANGFADVRYIYGDYMYIDELYEMLYSAKEAGAGMWK
jgi:micrococcal nuclease